MNSSEFLFQAVDWLLNSRIHNSDKSNNKIFGSFNNYYDLYRKMCPHAYTEITGYAAELLLFLYKVTNTPLFLENARHAGDWIIKMQYLGKDKRAIGSFLWNCSLSRGAKSPKAYSFDAAVCIGSLVELYEETNCNIYLEAAIRGANWLTSVMQNEDGSFKPFYDLSTKTFYTNNKWNLLNRLNTRLNWSEKKGCHHCKNALGLLKLYSVVKEEYLKDSAKRVCEWVLAQQELSGCFRANPSSKNVYVHTHCYATEGMLYSSQYLSEKVYFRATEKALDWLVKVQKPNGSLPDWFFDGRPSLTIDSSCLAQAMRLWGVMYEMIHDKRYHTAHQKVAEYLPKMQSSMGGYYLLKADMRLFAFKLLRLYSWPTIFAIHAFLLSSELPNGTAKVSDLW